MDTAVKRTVGSDTAQVVQDLNAKWRNYLSDEMNLDPKSFQLAQGCLGLQTTDSMGLFQMADAVPPSSAVGFYDATSMKRRSSAYGMLLNALLPETNPNGIQTALGDYYTQWMIWFAANPWQPSDTWVSRLERFGQQKGVDLGTIKRAQTAAQQAADSPLYLAITAFNDPTQQQSFLVPGAAAPTNLYTYSNNVTVAQAAIANGAALTISFDSDSESSDVSHTFAEGSASGFYDFFSGGIGGTFDQLNSKAASSSFTISGTINKYATVAVGPSGNWYTSAEVSRAVNAKNDNTVWDPQAAAGNYNSFFGQPDGAMARYVSELVLVSDYAITVTSKASFNQTDLQTIKTQANVGIWPFFSATASATHSTSVTLNSNSQLATTFTLNNGLIQIWGVNIQNQN